MPRRKLGTLVENTPKWALVLFDWDGCTVCVESRRLGGHPAVKVGSTADLSYDGEMHLVEVLALSDSEHNLALRDKTWSRGVRAKAIAATRDAREVCRRGKFGGFLTIKEDSESEEEECEVFQKRRTSVPRQPKDQPRVVLSRLAPTVRHSLKESGKSAPKVQQKGKETEKNRPKEKDTADFEPFEMEAGGRSLRILFQGAGETRKKAAAPARSPCYTADLTKDQADLLAQQVDNDDASKSNSGSQTHPVVILRSDNDIRSACERSRKVKLTRTKVEVWSTPFINSEPCCPKLQAIQKNQAEALVKLNRILEFLETPPQEISGLSDILRQIQTPATASAPAPARTSTPASAPAPAPTSTPASAPESQKATDNPRKKRQPLSAIQLFDKENCEGAPTPSDLFPERPEEVAEDEENSLAVPLPPGDQDDATTAMLDFGVNNDTITIHCPPNATIIDVKSPRDIVPGNCEFVINKTIQQRVRSTACSPGNFLWTMTKLLFSEEEMKTKKMNFNGKKGKAKLSPRRRHSLVHLYVENYNRRADGFRQAIQAVNNGLLTVHKKKKD